MSVQDLVERHAEVWCAATRHPFLGGVRNGALPVHALERWLTQDYVFVADLLWFQARLLARSPRPAQAVLAGGVVALEAELTWFERLSDERGLQLATRRHPTTQAYRELLERLDGGAFEIGIVALWAIERAYFEAWQSARPGAIQYRELVEHWTGPAFAEYVDGLQRAAEAVLTDAPEQRAVAEQAFLEVARLERAFWDMAVEAKKP